MIKELLTTTIFLLFCSASFSQEVWSLEKCVQYAIEHSLSLRLSTLNADGASVNKRIAEQGRMPNLDGTTSYNLSFGRRIDPTTNDFINSSFGNHGFSISGGILLFNGGRITEQIKQARLGKDAADLDVEQIKNDLALEVAIAYIQILFAEENLGNAQKSLDLINSQIDQMDKFIAAGSRPKNARLDLLAQSAQNEQIVVSAENEIDLSYLNLKQLLQLDGSFDLKIEVPDVPLPSEYEIEAASPTEIYAQALEWQPAIKAGELRKISAESGVAIAKTAMIPSLSAGVSVGSNWSSSARTQLETGTELMEQNFILNGEPFNVQFETPIFDIQKVNYFDQINQNIGYGFGITASVPIYGQGRSKGNLDLAKLDVVRSEIETQQVKNQLNVDVQKAVADAKAAKKQYEASLSTVEARRAAYADTEKRFNLGVANSFEFITAQNNRDQAETDLIIAKYDYIFKSKVLDYYQGKQITLN